MTLSNYQCSMIWRVIAIVSAIILGIIIAAPMIVSTEWGTQQVVNAVNVWGKDKIPGTLNIKDMCITWFGPQEIDGITLNLGSEYVINVPEIKSDSSLFGLALDAASAKKN
jgi:hypothetical protein